MNEIISIKQLRKILVDYFEEKGLTDYHLFPISYGQANGSIGMKVESWENPDKVMEKLIIPWLKELAKDNGLYVRTVVDKHGRWDHPPPDGCTYITIVITNYLTHRPFKEVKHDQKNNNVGVRTVLPTVQDKRSS